MESIRPYPRNLISRARSFRSVTHVYLCGDAALDKKLIPVQRIVANTASFDCALVDIKGFSHRRQSTRHRYRYLLPSYRWNTSRKFDLAHEYCTDEKYRFSHYYWPVQMSEKGGVISDSSHQVIFLFRNSNINLEYSVRTTEQINDIVKARDGKQNDDDKYKEIDFFNVLIKDIENVMKVANEEVQMVKNDVVKIVTDTVGNQSVQEIYKLTEDESGDILQKRHKELV